MDFLSEAVDVLVANRFVLQGKGREVKERGGEAGKGKGTMMEPEGKGCREPVVKGVGEEMVGGNGIQCKRSCTKWQN